jgi:hypothetical protein
MMFYDFGAGKGNSMARAVQWWGGVGVGFEYAEPRRKIAIGRGYNVKAGKLPDVMWTLENDSAQYSIINHVLEHLQDIGTGRKVIQQACRVSSEFVYIAGPWFESDAELFLQGYKWFCNDWPVDHPTRVTMLDIRRALVDSGKVKQYWLFGRDRIENSAHKLVYPLAVDTQKIPAPYEYDPAVHSAKGKPAMFKNCFSEICVIAQVGSGVTDYVDKFKANNGNAEMLMTETLC